ncbi:hypothetical protein ACQW08_01665 [Gluconobacter japonicus]|uniref:hypothetical protein n=1 Tax=Gluconobacter japonicus TaxID=376620 RepID=UPI003D265117
MSTNESTTADQRFDLNQLRPYLGDKIVDTMHAINAISGYEMGPGLRSPFVDFRNWLNTKPYFIEQWRLSKSDEIKKYGRFSNGVEYCERAMAECYYRLDLIRDMDTRLRKELADRNISSQIPLGSTMCIGNTAKIDFEYRSFVLSYRRALDYLSYGLSTYFNESQDSFNRFAKNILKSHPTAVSAVLAPILKRYMPHFSFVIGDEKGRSTRDIIAHKAALDAGSINIRNNGFVLFGGGENLGINTERGDDFLNPPTLPDVLETRMVNLQGCIADLLAGIREAITDYEKSQGWR